MKKTRNNWTPEQKKAVKDKIKDTRNNKTEEEKNITSKKRSEAAKKRMSNPKNNPMYGKKGKDNPNFGKKYGSFDYKKKFLPIFGQLLVELDKKNNENSIIFITESLLIKHTKKIKDCPGTPYRNPSEYNPWIETGFDGFFEDTKHYIVEKNIIIKSRFMKVENTRWAKLHFKRRKQLIDFIKENKRTPNRKENKALYEWYRSLINHPKSNQEYLKDGKKAVNDAIKKFTKTTAT